MLMGYTFVKHILEDMLSIFGLLWRGFRVLRNKFCLRRGEKKVLIVKDSKELKLLQNMKQLGKKNNLLKIHFKTSKELIDVNPKREQNLATQQRRNSSVFEFVN